MRAGRLWGMGLAAFLLFSGICRGQDSLNVTSLAQLYDFWDWVDDLAVSGNYVYVAEGYRGLRIMDFSVPTAPQELFRLPMTDYGTELSVDGDLLCTGGFTFEICVLDLSNPAIPQVIGSCQAATYDNQIDVQGDFLYVCNHLGPLEIFDLAEPSQPVLTGSLNLGNYAYGLDVLGRYAYVTGTFGLKIIDLLDPSQPTLIGSAPGQFGYGAIKVQGIYAYVTDIDSLRIFDVSDPAVPAPIGICGLLSTWCAALEIAGDYAYIGNSYGEPTGLSIIDVSNPSLPIEVGSYQTNDDIHGLGFCQGYLIADGIECGLMAFDVSDPENPEPAGECSYRGSLREVVHSAGTLFLTDFEIGLRVVDVSNAAQPQEIGRLESLAGAWSLALSGDHVYAMSGYDDPPHYVWVVDVSIPAEPLLVDTLILPIHGAGDISVSGSLLGVGGVWAGFLLYDVTNPIAPVLMSSYWLGEEIACGIVLLSGDIAYAGFAGNGRYQLHILDVSDPAQPHLLSILDIKVYGMDLSGNYLYVATGYDQSVVVVDVSDPINPVIVSVYASQFFPMRVCFQWEYLYVTSPDYGLRILDVRDPAHPAETGWYVVEEDLNAVAACGSIAFCTQDHSLVIYDCSAALPVVPDPEIVHPSSFMLHPLHPNPFNSTTVLSFDLPVAGMVSLEVFDIKGQRVGVGPPWRIPTRYNAGTHQITFDGSILPSGIYLARLTAGEFQQTQKLVLLK